MARRSRLTQEQILAILTDISEDVSEFEEDDELDLDDDYLPNENESSSSDSDVEEEETNFGGNALLYST